MEEDIVCYVGRIKCSRNTEQLLLDYGVVLLEGYNRTYSGFKKCLMSPSVYTRLDTLVNSDLASLFVSRAVSLEDAIDKLKLRL